MIKNEESGLVLVYLIDEAKVIAVDFFVRECVCKCTILHVGMGAICGKSFTY
jgi:hypothetical protein